MPHRDPEARRPYMRGLMKRRALVARLWPGLQRYADARGYLPIRALVPLCVFGLRFRLGEVRRVRATVGVPLVTGGLAEVIKTTPPSVPQAGQDREQIKAIAARMKLIDRQLRALRVQTGGHHAV